VRAEAAQLDLAGEVALEEADHDERAALGEERGGLGMAGDLGEQQAEDAAAGGLLDGVEEAVDDAREDDVGRGVEGGLGVGDGGEDGGDALEDGFEEGLLVAEVPVDEGGGLEAGVLGDALDGGAAEAVFGHDVHGGVEDLGAAALRRVGVRLIDHSIQCTVADVSVTESHPAQAPSVVDGVVPTPAGFHAGRARGHLPPKRARAVIAVLVVVGIAVAVWALRPAGGGQQLVASGTLEVEEVTLAAETSGRLQELSVDEGSRVSEGQLVGRLADPVLEVQARQAIVDPAQQQLSQAQSTRLQLVAPETGIVQKRLAHTGEYVGPGTPILTVADPTDLKLVLYVLEPDLARVSIGQLVSIRADGYAEAFQGIVRTIATRAEFTPRNVQTQKDRQNLVFAVTVNVPNPDAVLKAGLPVDATFVP
jgi:hypothetical protein